MKRAKAPTQIHWRAPALMVGALIAGILFAVGHHVFYSALHLKEVSTDQFKFAGWLITNQELNIAAGTAFAFLVKAMLVLAVSIAYVQLMFRDMLQNAHRVADLDTVYTGLNDLSSLLNLSVFYRLPTLLVLALVAWLLPIASIVSPAALSVIFSQTSTSSQMTRVPYPALGSFAFSSSEIEPWSEGDAWENVPHNSTINIINFGGPGWKLLRLAQAVGSSGSIIPIKPPSANTSWSMNFTAPTLACDFMPQPFVKDVQENLKEYLESMTAQLSYEPLHYLYSYLSWTNVLTDMPFQRSNNAGSNDSDWSSQMDTDWVLVDPSNKHLFVGMFPEARNADNWTHAFSNSAVLQCNPKLTVYNLNFTYLSTDQGAINMTTADIDDDVFQTHTDLAMISMLLANGDFVLKSEMEFSPAEYNEQSSFFNGSFIDEKTLRSWSYFALVQSFYNLLLGATNSAAVEADVASMPGEADAHTQIFTTVLADTTEINPLVPIGALTPAKLSQSDDGNNFDEAEKAFPEQSSTTTLRPLKDAIEELFKNMVVSTMSSPSMLTYSSDPAALSNVTTVLCGNVYFYTPSRLWLAYGLGIGLSALSVVIVLWTVADLNASFTANFSTIMRATKHASASADVAEQNPRLPGKDPLPRALAKAHITLGNSTGPLPSKPPEQIELGDLGPSFSHASSFKSDRSYTRVSQGDHDEGSHIDTIGPSTPSVQSFSGSRAEDHGGPVSPLLEGEFNAQARDDSSRREEGEEGTNTS